MLRSSQLGRVLQDDTQLLRQHQVSLHLQLAGHERLAGETETHGGGAQSFSCSKQPFKKKNIQWVSNSRPRGQNQALGPRV